MFGQGVVGFRARSNLEPNYVRVGAENIQRIVLQYVDFGVGFDRFGKDIGSCFVINFKDLHIFRKLKQNLACINLHQQSEVWRNIVQFPMMFVAVFFLLCHFLVRFISKQCFV